MTVLGILCIVGYILVSIPMAAYSRNRSVNKSFDNHYQSEKRLNGNRVYTKVSEEEMLIKAMDNATRCDKDDWTTAAFLGGFFWPAFVVAYIFHWVYKKAESAMSAILPKSAIEKKIEQIHTQQSLENQRKEMIRIGRRLNLDVKQLEELGE